MYTEQRSAAGQIARAAARQVEAATTRQRTALPAILAASSRQPSQRPIASPAATRSRLRHGQTSDGTRQVKGSVGLDDLATGVVAAVRADVVRAARMTAARAGIELEPAQRQVRTPPPRAPLRELDLRKCH